MTDPDRQVYISYAWGGDSERVVAAIDADLQGRGIGVVRDKRDLGYTDMIQDFMQEIGRGHAVVVVISDKYLKSPACMFELVEIVKNKDVRNNFVTGIILTGSVSDEVRDFVYQIKPPKLGWTDGCISVVVVDGAAKNDIFYATELTNDLGSDFEENIKKHLAP